jgi:serine/threonine protein kinase
VWLVCLASVCWQLNSCLRTFSCLCKHESSCQQTVARHTSTLTLLGMPLGKDLRGCFQLPAHQVCTLMQTDSCAAGYSRNNLNRSRIMMPKPYNGRSSDITDGPVAVGLVWLLCVQATPASDLYSLGATLLYLVSGQPPGAFPQKRMRIDYK